MKLTCAIIDDEYLARQYIKDYVERLPFLELKGDYDSPLMIMEELKSNAIDILFLDIQMPDITGLDFLKIINPLPCVILTTAYKEYALEGYEYNVVDYLLKPISFERFLKAINKAADKIEKERSLGKGADSLHRAGPLVQEGFMTIRADRRWYKINYDDLYYVEGQKAYVTFHTRNKKITALFSLKELEGSLPADRFIRIHKSFIVAVKHIETLEGNMIGIFGQKLAVGSNYRESVDKLFNVKSKYENQSGEASET
jgi:DNA-binding LytR/AlgR family response regulator